VTARQIQLRNWLPGVFAEAPGNHPFEAGMRPARRRHQENHGETRPRGYVVYSIAAPQVRTRPAITSTVSGAGFRARPDRRLRPNLYGRVLVERVEASPPSGMEARLQGDQLLRAPVKGLRIILAKFWIHISREEQLRRFEERKAIGYKAGSSLTKTGATARSGRLRGSRGGDAGEDQHPHRPWCWWKETTILARTKFFRSWWRFSPGTRLPAANPLKRRR